MSDSTEQIELIIASMVMQKSLLLEKTGIKIHLTNRTSTKELILDMYDWLPGKIESMVTQKVLRTFKNRFYDKDIKNHKNVMLLGNVNPWIDPLSGRKIYLGSGGLIVSSNFEKNTIYFVDLEKSKPSVILWDSRALLLSGLVEAQ
jgi:hypothetical protein